MSRINVLGRNQIQIDILRWENDIPKEKVNSIETVRDISMCPDGEAIFLLPNWSERKGSRAISKYLEETIGRWRLVAVPHVSDQEWISINIKQDK